MLEVEPTVQCGSMTIPEMRKTSLDPQDSRL